MKTGDKRDAPPLGVLVLLTAVLPGAGQLANNDKAKGYVFIAAALALLIMFFAKLADVFPYVHASLLAGVIPVATEEFVANIKTLGFILLASLFLFLAALVDALMVGRRRLH